MLLLLVPAVPAEGQTGVLDSIVGGVMALEVRVAVGAVVVLLLGGGGGGGGGGGCEEVVVGGLGG